MEPGRSTDQTRHEVSPPAMGPIYVIGPSSVGKGALCAIAHDRLGTLVFSVDDEFPGRERDWPPIREWFKELEDAAVPAFVDVGAGTQDIPELTAFLFERRERVVLVTDQAGLVFQRNVAAGHRTRAEMQNYLEVELGPARNQLYDNAGNRVQLEGRDVDAGPADEFCDIVIGLLPIPPLSTQG